MCDCGEPRYVIDKTFDIYSSCWCQVNIGQLITEHICIKNLPYKQITPEVSVEIRYDSEEGLYFLWISNLPDYLCGITSVAYYKKEEKEYICRTFKQIEAIYNKTCKKLEVILTKN